MEMEQTLPASLEAEVTLLGNLINDPKSVDIAIEIISTEDEFFSNANREIYRAILKLNERGSGINRVNLVDYLMTSGTLDKSGGLSYILKVSESFISSANTEDIANVIHEKYLFRRLFNAASELRETALKAQGNIIDVVGDAESMILDIGLNTSTHDPVGIGTILKSAADDLVEKSSLNGISGLSTGFMDLDALTSGFQKSDLILLAARPSMGKTAIMLNFAVSAAKEGKSVAIFSLEMSKEQLALRIFSQLANISISKLIKGDLETEDWRRIGIKMNEFSNKLLFIDDTSGITVSELRSKVRKLKLNHGLDLVLVDYLQLMEVGGRTENRQQEISKISRGLKGIAKELHIPLIALSQLSRAPELRQNKRPILSDLRESGAIEQDADLVMFLYRDEYYDAETEDKGIGEVIIAKHRNGPIGTIKLVFKGENTKFLDMQRVPDGPPQEEAYVPDFG